MPSTPTIELPQMERESARAYAARVAYVTMGPSRSIDKVADQLRGKSGSRSTTLLDWSSRFGWVESARRYDEAMAYVTVQQRAAEYQAAVEAQRGEASKIGGELIAMGRAIAAEVARRRDGMEYKPSDLAVAVKAILAGFDLRAHALDLDKLLPALLEGGDDA